MNLEEYQQMYQLEDSHWYFVGKRLVIKNILQKYLVRDNNNTYRVLDIGCGTGKTLEMLQQFGEVSGADSSTTALDFCGKRGLNNLHHLAAETSLPFPDTSFELITALDVLEHLDNDRQMIQEIRRVCSTGGKCLITVPAFMFLWSPHDEALQHRRRYTKKQLEQLLRSEGFSLVRISYSNCFLFPIAVAVRWLRSIFYRGKPFSEFFIQIPNIVNRLFLFALRLEATIIPKVSFPFGVSIVCLAEKPIEKEPSGSRMALSRFH